MQIYLRLKIFICLFAEEITKSKKLGREYAENYNVLQ